MRTRTTQPTPNRPAPHDPRQVPTTSPRLVALLESDTARAQRSRHWTAEADPSEWPAAVDDWFIGVTA
jgi:hypothetical protein